MRLGSKHRSKTSIATGLTLALLPLVAGTSSQSVLVADDMRQRHRAGALGPPVTYTMASRSNTRGAALEHIDPESLQLHDFLVSSPKGMRVWTASAMADHNVPAAASRAYRNAAASMARTDPACQIPWTLLAGIGRVESDHGRYGGSTLGADGVSRPLIIGVQLNGTGPVAAIRDTDNGRYDKDTVWDRAVGPMQFIPSTWRSSARDGDGDGVKSPNDLDDAALSAAAYLCSGGGSILGDSTMGAAVYRYNQDDYYVALVMAFERGYRTGVFIMPPPPAPEDEPTDQPRRKKRHGSEQRDRAGSGGQGDATGEGTTSTTQPAGGGGTSTSPEPSPKPKPKPEPPPAPPPEPTPSPAPAPEPTPETVTGIFKDCTGGYCLGSLLLDLGQLSNAGAQAAGDFDGNGTTGTNGEEVAGMLGTEVTMVVVKKAGGAGIYSINGVALS